ncbi:MAG TPA: undecaprenyl-phosphate glucose phosphotransferase, partial [Gemmataceae bacterium]|nr:undecaprenyl-phosphate glucose phosphotransferase [Gemmataceae bacterium]
MIKRNSQILCMWFLLWDLAMTGIAWISAYYVRFESGLVPLTRAQPEIALCWRNLPLVLLLAAVAYRLTGQYIIHRLRRLREEVVSVCKGTALMGLLVIAATFGMQDPYESRATFLVFFGISGVLVLTARRISWLGIQWLRSHGYNQTHSLIVGTGRVARKTARALRAAGWMGIKNIGFIED